MQRQSAIILAVLATSSAASAQTTNCMAMGQSMVQCHGTDGTSTNCVAMGPDMATCNSIGGRQADVPSAPSGDGGAALGAGLVGLINKINEGSFRKKVGKMLADGDCDGAIRFAFEKGRMEAALAIRNACAQQIAAAAIRPEELEARVANVAQRAKVPVEIQPGLTANRVQAIGTQLLFSFEATDPGIDLGQVRTDLTNETCANIGFLELLRAGGSLRAEISTPAGGSVGAALVTKTECGIP